MQAIGIIGFGQFGRFVYEVLNKALPNYQIKASSRSNEVDNDLFFSFEEVCSCDILIPCVPISNFKETLEKAKNHLKPDSLVIDVCSVKVYPKAVMLEVLPENVQIIATHPMFGPESYKKTGGKLDGLNLVIENVRSDSDTYNDVVEFLKDLNLNVIEMSAEEHDKLAAEFHFTTLFMAGVLKKLNLKRSEIDTLSYSSMMDFLEKVGADDLITKDMLKFNPYCQPQFEKVGQAYEEMSNYLLDNQ